MSRKRPNLAVTVVDGEPRIIAPTRITPHSAEFQSDVVEIESRPPPRIARMTLYGVTALILSAIVWASFSFVDEIVVAQGKLVTTKPTIVVQPLETSIIRSLDVSAGDIVQKGQVLATLDPTFSAADVAQKRQRFVALDAQVQRIEAELADGEYMPPVGGSTDEMLQRQLFGQRRAFYKAQLQNFDQQIQAQVVTLQSSRDEAKVLGERRDNLGRIETARQTLYERETGSLVNLLGSRDARLEVDANLARVAGSALVATHTLAKLEADRQAFIEDYRRTAMEELVEMRGEREAIQEELKKLELRHTMVALTAPAAAVVLELAQRSIGSVVREAEPLVTLVPLDVPLEAEVSVNTRDIARVDVADAARIKLDAFPFQKYGTAAGHIRTISHDAIASPDHAAAAGGAATAPAFRARIGLDNEKLRLPDGNPMLLLPGMTVAAEIKVGSRTVISYFLYPLIRGLDESLREP